MLNAFNNSDYLNNKSRLQAQEDIPMLVMEDEKRMRMKQARLKNLSSYLKT